MSKGNKIPTQAENPKGLHQRYTLLKLVTVENPQFSPDKPYIVVEEEVDDDAEYFVLRLDEGGSDKKHIQACRIGVQAYANAIEPHLPELAKDLRERYPIKSEK